MENIFFLAVFLPLSGRKIAGMEFLLPGFLSYHEHEFELRKEGRKWVTLKEQMKNEKKKKKRKPNRCRQSQNVFNFTTKTTTKDFKDDEKVEKKKKKLWKEGSTCLYQRDIFESLYNNVNWDVVDDKINILSVVGI